MPPVLLQNVREDASVFQSLQNIISFLKSQSQYDLGRHTSEAHQHPITTTVRYGEKGESRCGVLDWCILRVVVCIDQCLLDQQATHTVTQKQNRPRLDVVPLDPDCLKQLICLANEYIPILPIYRG